MSNVRYCSSGPVGHVRDDRDNFGRLDELECSPLILSWSVPAWLAAVLRQLVERKPESVGGATRRWLPWCFPGVRPEGDGVKRISAHVCVCVIVRGRMGAVLACVAGEGEGKPETKRGERTVGGGEETQRARDREGRGATPRNDHTHHVQIGISIKRARAKEG